MYHFRTYQAKTENYLEENFHILRVDYLRKVIFWMRVMRMRNITLLINHCGRPFQRRGEGCQYDCHDIWIVIMIMVRSWWWQWWWSWWTFPEEGRRMPMLVRVIRAGGTLIKQANGFWAKIVMIMKIVVVIVIIVIMRLIIIITMFRKYHCNHHQESG